MGEQYDLALLVGLRSMQQNAFQQLLGIWPVTIVRLGKSVASGRITVARTLNRV